MELQGTDRALGASNCGFRLLQKMGWRPGTGLGRREQGIVEPLKMKENLLQLGLGKSEEYDEMAQAATSERRRLAEEVEETAKQERERLARALRKEQVKADVKSSAAAFFCGDCQKQYKTVKEMENHLSSYDHHHRKRLRDLQRQQRLANAGDDQRLKRRRGEQQKEELMLQRRIQQAAAEASAASPLVAVATSVTPSATVTPSMTATPAVTTQKVGFVLGKGLKGKKPGKKPSLGISSAFSLPGAS